MPVDPKAAELKSIFSNKCVFYKINVLTCVFLSFFVVLGLVGAHTQNAAA
jgi:hypothetical protein